jgi:hypothetical protein
LTRTGLIAGRLPSVFDSRLLHMSTDNTAVRTRAALTFHYAGAGTVDRSAEVFGQSPYHHWLPADGNNPASPI